MSESDEFVSSTERLSKAANDAAKALNNESNAADNNASSVKNASNEGVKASQHLTTAYKTTGAAAKSLSGSLNTANSVTNLFSSSSGTLTGFLGNLIPVLSGATKGVKGLNAAIKANPIAFVLTALITLISLFDPIVSGLKSLVKWFTETFTAAGRAAKALREFNEVRNAQRAANAKMVKEVNDDIELGNKRFKASLDEKLNIMRSNGKSETAIRAEEIRQTIAHNSKLIKIYDSSIKKLKGNDPNNYAALKQYRNDLWKQNFDLKNEFASLGGEIEKSTKSVNKHLAAVKKLTDAERLAIKQHEDYKRTFETTDNPYVNAIEDYNNKLKIASKELSSNVKGITEQQANFVYSMNYYAELYKDNNEGLKKQLLLFDGVFTEEERKVLQDVVSDRVALNKVSINAAQRALDKVTKAGAEQMSIFETNNAILGELGDKRKQFYISDVKNTEDYVEELEKTYNVAETSDMQILKNTIKSGDEASKIIEDAYKEKQNIYEEYNKAFIADFTEIVKARNEENTQLENELENQIELLKEHRKKVLKIQDANIASAKKYAADYSNAMRIKNTDAYSTNANDNIGKIWEKVNAAISEGKSHNDNREKIKQAQKETNAMLDTALAKQLDITDAYHDVELKRLNEFHDAKELSEEEYQKKVQNLEIKTSTTKTSLTAKNKKDKEVNDKNASKKIAADYEEQLNEYSSYASGVSSIASSLAERSKENSEEQIKYQKVAMAASMAAALAKGVSASMEVGWPMCLVAAASTVAELIAMFQQFKQIGNSESYSKGGLIRGAGTGTSDSITANVSNGESVINARSTAQYAPLLSAINQANGGNAIGSAASSNRQAALTSSYINMTPVVSVESINRQTKIYNAVNVE